MPQKIRLSSQQLAAVELEYRTRIKTDVDPRAAFQVKYWNDPAAFAHDCIEWPKDKGLADYQNDALSALPNKRRVSVRGPHGLGKTATAAITILWFSLTRDGTDWKVVTTASAWRQLKEYLWPELHKWERQIKWDVVGRRRFQKDVELLDLSLKLRTGEAFAVASNNSDLIEGAHADHLLYVFDEAKAIPVETWDAAEGAFSTGDCMALAISTPGEPQGRFYEIQKRAPGYQDWWVRRVTKDEAIAAGRMDTKWAIARKKQWGEKSAVYQNRVEGEFAASDEDGVIALSWIERSNERWQLRADAQDWQPLSRLGVDIGRGGDPSVIARRHDMAIKSLEEMNERDVMAVTGRVKGILDANKAADAAIDVIGIGAGVVDRLREFRDLSARVLGFNASEKTEFKDKSGELMFVNERSAAWWNLRELLQDDMIDLPPNDVLIGELTSPKYKLMSGGRIQVEAKEEIKKRINRSTNYADAVIMAFWRRGSGVKDEEIDRMERDEINWDGIPLDMIQAAVDSGVEVPEEILQRLKQKEKA